MPKFFKTFMLGFLLMSIVSPAHAGIIFQDTVDFTGYTIAANNPIGQSFLAEDPLLGSIAFAFYTANDFLPNDPITMTLFEGAGIGGTVLDTVTQTLSSTLSNSLFVPPVFIDFDFSGTALTVGTTYTVGVETGSFRVAVRASAANPYADGQLFRNGLGFVASQDLGFRVTPAPASVPTPSALLLMGTSLFGLIAWRWRNTRLT